LVDDQPPDLVNFESASKGNHIEPLTLLTGRRLKMKKAARITTAGLALSFLFLLPQNQAYPQQIPPIPKIPPGSITLRVNVAEPMMTLYWQVYLVTKGKCSIWAVFYDEQKQNIAAAYPIQAMTQLSYNTFSTIQPWRVLARPGSYLVSIIGFGLSIPVQSEIEYLKISSNTEQALKDNHTLIVSNSTGVAPRKGPEEFKIRYQLNEDSNMVYKIMDTDEGNTEVWKSSMQKVVKGTRGFEWDCKDAKKNHLYRAEVEATSTTNEAVWDHDLSDKFETLN
jgi:hypothetical protein